MPHKRSTKLCHPSVSIIGGGGRGLGTHEAGEGQGTVFSTELITLGSDRAGQGLGTRRGGGAGVGEHRGGQADLSISGVCCGGLRGPLVALASLSFLLAVPSQTGPVSSLTLSFPLSN